MGGIFLLVLLGTIISSIAFINARRRRQREWCKDNGHQWIGEYPVLRCAVCGWNPRRQ